MAEDTPKTPEVPEEATAAPVVADEVTAKLQELDVPAEVIVKIKDELGVSSTADLNVLTAEDLVTAGMKLAPARRVAAALVPVTPVAEPTTLNVSFDDVLPAVLSDESWLTALRAGGVRKVDESTVIAAVRAALADRVNLYDIPSKLVAEMERFADTNEEQVDPEFFRLRKQITRREYAVIFEAIEGLDGSFVTEARKKELLARLNRYLWPSISEFNSQLKSWQEAWMQGAANPAMMVMALTGAGGLGTMPPGMMQPPDTGILRDSAAAVNDAINKVFAGTGVQIAAALAYDASKIKETLENPRLPSLIGAANREQMLKQLGVAVSATYPRLEVNLTRFVLATMQVENQPGGSEEYRYFGMLNMLGSQIPWDQLDGRGGRPTGIGGGKL